MDLSDLPAKPVLGAINPDGRVYRPHLFNQALRWLWPDTGLVYRYEAARDRAVAAGQVWVAAWVPQTDAEFAAAGLSQEQVDAMLDMYGRNVAHLFTPRTWSWRQRVALAALFLFGWSK